MTKLLVPWAAAFLLSAFALPAQSIDMEQARADDDFRWGVRAFHETHFGDAVLSLEKSLSRKPGGALPRVWLGNALFKNGYEEEALNEWRQALEREPGNSLLKNRIQLINLRRGVARELARRMQYVVASEISADRGKYYPLKRPSAVRARPDGTAYVVAFASSEILLLDANNGVKKVLSGGLKGFGRPFDCLELGGHLFISEYGANRLLKASLQGDRVKEFGSTGGGPGELLGPQYLAADESGYLYVTDWGNSRVNKYDQEGAFILAIGGKGSGRQPLAAPTGIAVAEGRVYVADRTLKRILCYDASGNYLADFGAGILEEPEGIAFMGEGTLLVADSNRILAFRLESQTWEALADLSGEAGKITSVSPSPNGDLYVVDFDRNRILVLSEMSTMYMGFSVQVERILSNGFPEIFVDVSVQDRWGNPVVGLTGENFLLTERFAEVNAPELARANTDPAPLALVLVVEKSLALKGFREELAACVESLHTRVVGAKLGDMEVVSAGEKPVLEAGLGSTRLATVRAAVQDPWVPGWRFDRAVRLAAAQLAPRSSRKAVVFLTPGTLPPDAFAESSLSQVARYLANNGIAFYVVRFGQEAAEELAYLCSETGGKSYFYFNPKGIDGLVAEAAARLSSVYTLKYRSRTNPNFGRDYIDLQVEASLHRRSGRAESGYFAPLSD